LCACALMRVRNETDKSQSLSGPGTPSSDRPSWLCGGVGELILVVRGIRGRGQALAGLMCTAINIITPVSLAFSMLRHPCTWCSGWAHLMSAETRGV
jgi:hypothetical protein